ncbi:MAG TPA: hypothetical protein VFB65_20820 [Pyrinomonadaceae bacterium]|nr:hypothetical protein [Pyrinomonadaceae bacterium]
MSVIILLMSVLIYQTNLTDADKKQILSLLFQPDQERTILLSPRTDPNWMLDLPGIRFKKLSYGEERRVSEYYELRDIKIHDDYVELWISKGNYCKKTGTGYELRKKDGEWKAKIVRSTESYMVTGSVCLGCKTGSGSVYKLKHATEAKEPPPRKDLLLTGNVLATRCKPGQGKNIFCDLDVSLEFSNHGSQPVIILQPHGMFEFWQGGESLALTKAESEAYNYVYSREEWPSLSRSEEYRQLAEGLDQPTPPRSLTRAIAPGESWKWKTKILLVVAEQNTCDEAVGVAIGWREIKRLSAPVWLRVSYEMWPFNVENFKKGLGGTLRERWKKHGTLYLEEERSDRWFAHLTSEPIELDFQSVEIK